MPDISDLLKRYPRQRESADVAAATSSAPIVLPPPSLRSSTFDGKTIFLKRKSRVVGASVRLFELWTHAEPDFTARYTRGHPRWTSPLEIS